MKIKQLLTLMITILSLGCFSPGCSQELIFKNGFEEIGFTVFEPSEDTIIYYVSNEGNDNNDGLSPESPLQFPTTALGNLRDGFPDWILFRRGDTFQELGQLRESGRSMEEPILLSSYGESPDRPIFVRGFRTNGSGGAPASTDYIAVVSLKFYNPIANPSHPQFDPMQNAGKQVSWLRGTQGLWIEDCVFQFGGLSFNTAADGVPAENVVLFRTQILDAYKTTGLTQGLFARETINFTLNECLVDHNGWIAGQGTTADSSTQKHNIYFQKDTVGSTIANSIVMRASSHGVMFRGTESLVEGNFLFQNPINVLLGGGNAPLPPVIGIARDNVILEGINMNTGQARGWGIDVEANTIEGTTVNDNIIASCIGTGGTSCRSITIRPDATYDNNFVQDWGQGSLPGPASVTLLDYAQSIGLNTLEEFYAALRAQSKQNWNEDLTTRKINEYFRKQL